MFIPSPGLTERARRGNHELYQFNPLCECEICRNGGTVPEDHPERGHSFAYGEPHLPPSRSPWTRT